MYYSEEKIIEVREASDLLAVVGQYVELKRGGGSNYMGLCPFHAERTPSFNVNPDKGFFYCFGCHAGGDVIKFTMMISSMTFPEAVEHLAQRNGVALPERGSRGGARPAGRAVKERLLEVMARAEEHYLDNLWNSSAGLGVRNYLRARGMDEETSRDYGLGYSLPDWQGLSKILIREGFEPDLLLEAGLVKQRSAPGSGQGFYDAFRDRLTIPVMDADGRVVAFGARLTDSGNKPPASSRDQSKDSFEGPKYINSPLTPIYKKGSLLYGFPQARPHVSSSGSVFVVEGYFDLIAMAAAGIKNVVASMGTALTQPQVNMLRGRAKMVYLLFDGDPAGREAAKKALPKLLNAEIEGRVVPLPHGHDPDSFVRAEGPEALLSLCEEKSQNVLDYAADKLLSDHPDTLVGKARVLRDARDLLSEVGDSGKARLLQSMLAQRLGVDPMDMPLRDDAPQRPAMRSIPLGDHPSVNDVTGKILFHILSHPETAKMLPGLEDYWPEDATKPLFLELSAQAREGGGADPQRLLRHERDEFLEAMISKAAVSGRSFDPETAVVVAQSYAARLKERRYADILRELTLSIKKAHLDGDDELVRTLSEKRRKVDLDLRESRSYRPMS